jgi:hypothetical protein
MHLFLGWRAMEDRIGFIGHAIEYCLWGDGRARHTFLLASTDEHPLVMIEIDVGDRTKGICKSMKLNIMELNEIPKSLAKIEFIGEIQSQTALRDLIQSANQYIHNHPNYHVLLNNCRTFVEYLIDQIPAFHHSVPRKNGSILEYYHAQAKHEHPGALIKSKKFLKATRDFHRLNRRYKYNDQLVLDMQLPQVDMNNNLPIVEE